MILALSFFYFTFSCGLEAFFQSQSFTFALCGPHLFPPSQAATLTTIYFSRWLLSYFLTQASSFLTGRFSGILLSNFVSTTTIILCSQVDMDPSFNDDPGSSFRLAACSAPSSWRSAQAGFEKPSTLELLPWASLFPQCLPQVYSTT